MTGRAKDRLDMTGLWHGTYGYPAFAGPTTPFAAHLDEAEGTFWGTIIEPNTMGRSSEELRAIVAGMRAGQAVDFIKTYDGASDAAHDVDYVGHLSSDGLSVTGVWSLGPLDGTFEMHRDEAIGEEVEQEAVEEIEVPRSRI